MVCNITEPPPADSPATNDLHQHAIPIQHLWQELTDRDLTTVTSEEVDVRLHPFQGKSLVQDPGIDNAVTENFV